MRFRPTFWATALALPVLIVLIALGTWQVQRLQWKIELIEARSARIAMSPIPSVALGAVREGWGDEKGLKELEYMPVVLDGTYVGSEPLRLLPRVRDGKQGVHLVALFDAAGPLGTVLVDRGWAPLRASESATLTPEGPVRVAGYVRLFVEPGMFVPDNEPDANNWFYMDEAPMRAAVGAPPGVSARFFVQAGPDATPPSVYPIGSVPDVNLRNSHLEYAVTWYAFAVVFLVIFVVFHWNRKET